MKRAVEDMGTELENMKENLNKNYSLRVKSKLFINQTSYQELE